MEDVVIHTSPITFTEMLNSACTIKLIINFVALSFIYSSLQKNNPKTIIRGRDDDNLGKQKLFVMGFSHELLNHVNMLTGAIYLSSLEELPEKARVLVQSAQTYASHLRNLLDNILDTGKIDADDLEINYRPTRIYESIETTWGICAELIKQKRLHGRIRIDRHIPQVLSLDYHRINQVILNIVDNAVRYTEHGNIDITAEWLSEFTELNDQCFEPIPFNYKMDDEGIFEKNQAFSLLDDTYLLLNHSVRKLNKNQLKLKTSSARGVLKIIVKDTGCGISDEDADRVFQRFQKLDTYERRLGTGLGLFVTRKICQKMNGDIRLFSRKSKGSTFIICLPMQAVQGDVENLHDSEVLRVQIHQKMLKAMIVDDVSFNHLILENTLKKLKIEVSEVAINGQEAFEKYRDNAHRSGGLNIVTMDLEMPIMNGKISAEKIREFEATNGLKPCLLIIISGNCSAHEILECIDRSGPIRADAFLKKPINLEELEQIIFDHVSLG